MELDMAELKGHWPSCWQEDEDNVEDFSQEEIDNDPSKRILWASEHGKGDIVADILASDTSLVSSNDSDAYTPLHRASYNNHPEVAKLLLTHGANVLARTEDGWTPLHSAARWNSVDTAKVLLAAGADVNTTTKGGLTPLHLASMDPDNGQILAMLLSCPFVDVNICSNLGDTARALCERHSPHSSLFDMASDNINQLYPSS